MPRAPEPKKPKLLGMVKGNATSIFSQLEASHNENLTNSNCISYGDIAGTYQPALEGGQVDGAVADGDGEGVSRGPLVHLLVPLDPCRRCARLDPVAVHRRRLDRGCSATPKSAARPLPVPRGWTLPL